MKTKLITLSFLLLFPTSGVFGQGSDPLGELSFPPEVLIFYQQEIGLTDETRNDLISLFQKASEKTPELERLHKKEVETLADLLKAEHPQEQTALALLDNVLDRERDLKRMHLSLALGVKNKLSAEQQTKVLEIKKRISAGELLPPAQIQKQLQEKLQKVQDGVQQWQDDSRDPSPVAEIMEEFEPLMKEGKHQEADAVLNRALKRLSEK